MGPATTDDVYDVAQYDWLRLIFVFSTKLYLILEDVELEDTDSTTLNITNGFKTGSNQCWDY